MSFTHLPEEQARRAEQLLESLKASTEHDLHAIAELLASQPDDQLFGRTEFVGSTDRSRATKSSQGAIMSRTLQLWVLILGLALHQPPCIHAQKGSALRLDRFGDPLPVGALTRLGTVRFHGSSIAAF